MIISCFPQGLRSARGASGHLCRSACLAGKDKGNFVCASGLPVMANGVKTDGVDGHLGP